MNDSKTKLGQVKPYAYDASNFKSQLKAELVRRYRAQYGIEEDFAIQVSEKASFFSFKRFVFAPIMAIFALVAFVSYEYVTKPMTAYAYLKRVEKHNKNLEGGFEINTIHTVNGYELNVNLVKDKTGDIHVSVMSGGFEVENFVMHDGVLYVKEEVGLKEEKAMALTSVMNSLMLAELSDPQDEWKDLMNREDVDFSEAEDGLVKLSYEEDLDGDVFVNELYFRDFAQVKRTRVAKNPETVRSIVSAKTSVETIEYGEIRPVTEEIEKPVDYVVFVSNDKFNEKMTEFVDTEVDDLVREYVALPEKEAYFTWNQEKENTFEMSLPAEENVKIDTHVAAEVADEGLALRALPVSNTDNVELKLPNRVEIDLPKSARNVPDAVGDLPVSTSHLRDAYLEEVFYDLLEDDKPREVNATDREIPKNEPVVHDKVTPVIEPVGGEVNVSPKAEIDVRHEKDFSNIELPKPELEKRAEILPVGSTDNSVDSTSNPSEVHTTQINSDIESEHTEEKKEDEKAPSYTDLIKDREALQQDLANRRFQLRMEDETNQLNPIQRTVVPLVPVDEFRKGE